MEKELIYNYIIDLKKKDINKFTRAKIIKQYISSEKISQREFGRRFNLPKSTVEDWLLLNKINENEYNNIKETEGLKDTEMYKLLRNNKKLSTKDIIGMPSINIYLQKMNLLFINCLNNLDKGVCFEYNNDTLDLINNNINYLNKIKKCLYEKQIEVKNE